MAKRRRSGEDSRSSSNRTTIDEEEESSVRRCFVVTKVVRWEVDKRVVTSVVIGQSLMLLLR